MDEAILRTDDPADKMMLTGIGLIRALSRRIAFLAIVVLLDQVLLSLICTVEKIVLHVPVVEENKLSLPVVHLTSSTFSDRIERLLFYLFNYVMRAHTFGQLKPMVCLLGNLLANYKLVLIEFGAIVQFGPYHVALRIVLISDMIILAIRLIVAFVDFEFKGGDWAFHLWFGKAAFLIHH